MATCSVDGCNRQAHARSWCRNHYERWKRHGDPTVNLRPGGTCSVEGCDLALKAKGYCSNHYKLAKRWGGPAAGPGKGSAAGDPVLRFWVKVDRTDECWVWTGGLRPDGYGNFWFEGRTVGAHRFAWELVNGPVPSRMQLDHLCRNRACVNPAHLEPVTARTNVLRGESLSARNARKTHCPKGHAYGPETTTIYRGRRYCLICQPLSVGRRV